MSAPGRVVSLILAAGAASRYGSDKRQALWRPGVDLLSVVVGLHVRVSGTVLVVTREDDDFAEAVCRREGARRVPCADAAAGMGRSLAAGLSAAAALVPTPDAVLLALADMPAVREATLTALRTRFEATGAPVAPRHQGRIGHPRILPRAHWPALLALQGDEGARGVVDWSLAQLLDSGDPGVLLDIDTPEALARALRASR